MADESLETTLALLGQRQEYLISELAEVKEDVKEVKGNYAKLREDLVGQRTKMAMLLGGLSLAAAAAFSWLFGQLRGR